MSGGRVLGVYGTEHNRNAVYWLIYNIYVVLQLLMFLRGENLRSTRFEPLAILSSYEQKPFDQTHKFWQ